MAIGALQIALFLALLLALGLAVFLWASARGLLARTGLPRGQVVYADTGRWERCEPLYAPRYKLSGKPDYLVRAGREIIPVEVKPGRRAREPYASDVMQLLAYCLLVEETQGCSPSHGLLRYEEQTFRIPYDRSARRTVLATLDAMRRDFAKRDVPRSHAEPARCHFCGHRERCREALS